MIQGLPNRLHDMRTKHGLSQKQVAEKVGVSPSIVSGYETGERTPSTEVLLALSYLFQCSTDYLLGKQTTVPSAIINADGLTADQLQAIQTIVAELKIGNEVSRS